MTARVALVTGGASGIGAAIATMLAEAGRPVAIVDRDEAGAERLAARIAASGATARAFVHDVADIASIPALLDAVAEALGPPVIVVNNAAVGGGEAFCDVTPERFDAVFAVSVRGAFFLTQAMLPAMRAAGFGRIVNIASLIAVRGDAGNPHYAGAKAAMLGFVRAWARELAPFGITANAVVPALTDTPMARAAMDAAALAARAAMVPASRLATPQDCARLVTFLASDEAAFTTGQVVSANGGEFVGAM